MECMNAGLVDESVVFVDSTHVKASANSKKYGDVVVEEQAQWYEKELLEEIDRDREAHGKKPLKKDTTIAESKKASKTPIPPERKKRVRRKRNTSSRVKQTLRVAGFARANTNMYLRTISKQRVTFTA